MNSKKMEKASPATVASVSNASVVSTRTLVSSTTSTTAKMAPIKDIPNGRNNPKSHPKTLDIPNAASKKSGTITAAAITNGTTAETAISMVNGHKGPPPAQSQRGTKVIASSNKTVSDAPRRICNGNGVGDTNSTKKQQQSQPHHQQQNASPASSTSSSTSPSSAMSGIHPEQFASICREVANVREEHLSIRKSLSEREGELGKTRVALRNIAQERDLLRNKVSHLEQMLKHSPEMYSQVAAILSSSNDPFFASNQSASPAVKTGCQISPLTSPPAPSSAKHSPEEISTANFIPQEQTATNKSSCGYVSLKQTESIKSQMISSPVRNSVHQHPQQQKQQQQQLKHEYQNQKLASLPPSTTITFPSRPNIVPFPSQAGTMDSPRKCNGNGSNFKKMGSFVGGGGGGMEDMQKIGINDSGRTGDGGGGGNFVPCLPPQPSSPNISNNINSQESHQASHNNKNLQQKQHSMQQSNYNMNNVKHATTTNTIFTTLSDKNNMSIYYGQRSEHEARGSSPPSLSLQYLEYHNGNSRNVNDTPAMTNSNNNNNHHLKSTSAGGGRQQSGDGGGRQHYYHQNQPHLSQSGITGLDLMLLGPDCSTKVVEHLVHPVAIESSIREIQHTLVLKGVPMNGDRMREVEIEIDRLNSRIDHLRSQNDVLTLNLEDAKSHADRLTVLLGKYESNNVALQLALRYSDQMSDAYEVLSALLETELGQVVTRIHAAGQLQLICAPPPLSQTSPTSPNGTSGTVVVSRSVVTSSGNNNNSNDNSPSEHAPVPSTLSPTQSSAGKNGSSNNTAIINGNNPEKQGKKNDDTNQSKAEKGAGADERTDNGSTTTSPVGSDVMAMVPVKNHLNDRDKVISPTSPSTATPPLSTKAMNLVEQARRNRLAAEQAARFLLSRFSSVSLHVFQQGGVIISPIGSLDNNNGHCGGGGDGNSSFFRRPTCQSNSTTSINSVSSNLSNMSGEASISLSSPSVDDGAEGKVDDGIGMKQQIQNKNQEEQEHTSVPITCATGNVKEEGMEVAAINQENIKKGSTGAILNGTSPTTAASSKNIFRAPFLASGNGPVNGCTGIITSLLPLLRNAAAAAQERNHPNNGTTSSPEAISAAIEPAIRHLVSTLKAERDAVKRTVMELEREGLESLTPSPKPSSPYYCNGTTTSNNNNSSSSNATPTAPWSPAEARKLDLETAVLMQELMAMKEERAELRAQLFLVEKEKDSLELRLRSHESQEDAYRARINYLKSEIMDCKSYSAATATTVVTTTLDAYHQDRNRNDIVNTQQQQQQQQIQKNNGNNRNLETIINNNNNNNQNVNWEREALLKKRIHELAGTLEKVTVSSQVREKQNQEMINELNRANGILMQTLDVAKKKYQNRIKKMEDQILYVSERHAAQLKLFGGEKISTAASKYHA